MERKGDEPQRGPRRGAGAAGAAAFAGSALQPRAGGEPGEKPGRGRQGETQHGGGGGGGAGLGQPVERHGQAQLVQRRAAPPPLVPAATVPAVGREPARGNASLALHHSSLPASMHSCMPLAIRTILSSPSLCFSMCSLLVHLILCSDYNRLSPCSHLAHKFWSSLRLLRAASSLEYSLFSLDLSRHTTSDRLIYDVSLKIIDVTC